MYNVSTLFQSHNNVVSQGCYISSIILVQINDSFITDDEK